MAMALPMPGDEFPGYAVGDYEGASVDQTFELFSAAAPKGWRVELIEGEIYVTPPANSGHEKIVTELVEQVVARRTDKRLRNSTGIGLNVPGASSTGHVIPDLVIAPRDSFEAQENWNPTHSVLLVAEVTSASTASRDRVQKIRGYARAGIPVYLVIDRQSDEVIVCSDPVGDHYARRTVHRLGTVVPLPDPLGFAIDTAEF
ncbi:Uma2 family endonuclease [Streptomyces sp. NPDC048717]|uniref:Uma2 family endonuclease n=1 Tax=Streptomyces sp. NPDC048717 TaxID=3154928 RepID=UPI003445CAE4